MNAPVTESLPIFEAGDAPEAVANAIRAVGGAVVRGAADDRLVCAVESELSPFLERTPFSEGYFMGRRTKRTSRLVAKSPAARELIMAPLVLETVGRLSAGLCYNFQLHSTVAVQIHPGETAQTLHRDDNVFPLRHPGPPLSINAIWAIDEFAEANGGTRVIPTSHTWDDERQPEERQAIAVEMPRGSVLLFDTALYHGGGANRSAATRFAVLFAYSLGWLRQLENQYLAVPPPLAAQLPRPLRELCGYRSHGFLGSFESRDPAEALNDEVPDVFAAQDLYTHTLQRQRLLRR